MYKLTSKCRTLVKSDPIQSNRLNATYYTVLSENVDLSLSELKIVDQHYRINLKQFLKDNPNVIKVSEELNKLNYVFIFADHLRLNSEDRILIPVPYYSQKDNKYYPSGTCNVTSVAMCLAAFGVKPKYNDQLEDDLFEVLDQAGKDRHAPYDLKWLIEQYGLVDDFTESGSIAIIKQALREGKLVIVHGYFTSSGHIIPINGDDDTKKSFIVNDPWGEYPYSDYEATGANLYYSYNLINNTCAVENLNSIWCHRIYPPN